MTFAKGSGRNPVTSTPYFMNSFMAEERVEIFSLEALK